MCTSNLSSQSTSNKGAASATDFAACTVIALADEKESKEPKNTNNDSTENMPLASSMLVKPDKA